MPQHVELLKRFLADPTDLDVADCGYPFVTISRLPGAGGHTLGRDIIRHLDSMPDEGWNRGWELFDQKLCAYLAKDPASNATFDSLIKEEYQRGLHQSVYEMLTSNAESYKLQQKIAAVIRFLAHVGKVVIIGRAGMYITRRFHMGTHLRLVAPEDFRVHRMANDLQVELHEARREARKQEADRVKLLRDIYGQNIDDPLLYDAVLNTERLTDNNAIASSVVELVKNRWKTGIRSVASPFDD